MTSLALLRHSKGRKTFAMFLEFLVIDL